MNDPAGIAVYSVDSSFFMDWQQRFYPTDVFPTVVERVEELIGAERFIAPALVREELDKVGTADLSRWIAAHKGIFIPTRETLVEAQAIKGRFTGLLDPKAEHEEADSYVIAIARLRSAVVVTQETAASEKRNPKRTHYIPDVCRDLGIPCINFLGLMRREGWRF